MSRNRRRYLVMDVFTDRSYGGNPLALLPEAEGLSVTQMQQIAREFNLSETAFIRPPRQRGETHRLRIFTPTQELPFAGHPTIGAALALAAEGWDRPELVFGQAIGPVRVSLRQQKQGRSAWLWAAKLPETGPPAPPTAALAALLGLRPTDILAGEWGPAAVSAGIPYLVVPVRDADVLARAELDLQRWREILKNWWANQVYLVAPLDGPHGTRYSARMFGPAIGIPEDPATGSAATAFPGWLAPRLGTTDGILTITIEQGAGLGRPSTMMVEAELEDGELKAVRVGGTAVAIAEGTLRIPDSTTETPT
jgi:trans-2,3-dihydro-3-hydroxyanthranilate isomerase